jgi:hypothetical protein
VTLLQHLLLHHSRSKSASSSPTHPLTTWVPAPSPASTQHHPRLDFTQPGGVGHVTRRLIRPRLPSGLARQSCIEDKRVTPARQRSTNEVPAATPCGWSAAYHPHQATWANVSVPLVHQAGKHIRRKYPTSPLPRSGRNSAKPGCCIQPWPSLEEMDVHGPIRRESLCCSKSRPYLLTTQTRPASQQRLCCHTSLRVRTRGGNKFQYPRLLAGRNSRPSR